MEYMETDSVEELWSYDGYDHGYDQEMSDGIFGGGGGKNEDKKPAAGGSCDPSKKAPEKTNQQQPCPQKAKKPACEPEKKERHAEKNKASCSSRPKAKKLVCPSEKKKAQKKVKRAACGVVKKKKKPPCGTLTKKRHSRKKNSMPRSRNPFIIFFLKTLYKQSSKKHVTEVAREAGKKWCCMSNDQKKVYQKMASLERRRRCKNAQRQARKEQRKC